MQPGRPELVPVDVRTYSFALALIRAYRALPPRDQAERVIWAQLLKSGTSAGANSAESGGAQSRPDWLTRRFIALKELRETLYWLRLYRDVTRTDRQEVTALLDEADQLVAIFTAIVKRARASKKVQGRNNPR
jgi:four helix bundle protein